MKIGYVRVSTRDQNPDRQIKKLRELGVEERFLFVDRQSGKDFDRPRYQAMRQIIREGDLLLVDSIDRLGRNYDGILKEWKTITREIGADIVALDNETLFDSRKFRAMGDIGKLMEDQFLSLLAYVAEQERKKIKERQREGIILAREKGVRYGRPKRDITPEFMNAYNAWKRGEITGAEAYRQCGFSAPTFYRRVKELEQAMVNKK